MKEVVLDTETTGISIKEGHRIVEIGCIELENLIPTKNKFHCYLNPERKVSEKALEVHGYTDEFLSTKQKFKEVVLDTETTGISVKEGHRIVEIGCIELDNLVPTKNKFHCYLNPERKVSEKAFEVHGYSDDFLSKQKKFQNVVEEFLKFINGKKLIIHNAEFDLAPLNHELEILGKDKINNEIIDTLILARDKFPGSSISLDALCKRYRIDNSKRVQHTALIDCDLLAKVYINLIDQKEPTLDFQKQDDKFNEFENRNILYFKKVVKPSSDELKKHKEFLKKDLKKNFFN